MTPIMTDTPTLRTSIWEHISLVHRFWAPVILSFEPVSFFLLDINNDWVSFTVMIKEKCEVDSN